MESRCLVADFDSTEQASIFHDFPAHDSMDTRLTRRLPSVVCAARLGRIISDCLAVPSNQILDGCVLLHIGPEGFGKILGDDSRLSIVVLGSSDSLAGDLIDIVNNLQSFAFSTFHVFDVDELVLSRHAPHGRVASTVAEAFDLIRLTAHRAGGRVVTAVESMVTKWSAWLTAEERGVLNHERRQPFEDWLPTPPSDSVDIGADLAATLSTERARSGALKVIRSLAIGHAERDIAWSWWNGEYLDAIAVLHGAFWLTCSTNTLSGARGRPAADDRGRTRRESSLALQGNALGYLQIMPGAVFAGIFFKTQLTLSSWEEHANDRDLQVISHIVGRECEPVDIHRIRFWLTIRIASTLVVAAVCAVASGAVGAAQNRWSSWVLIAVIAVVATLPLGDVESRFNMRKRSVAAVIRRSRV